MALHKTYIQKENRQVAVEREKKLHRPYIRKEVRETVEARAEKNEKGQFLDANTHEPIEGQYDLGHKAGHEYWREAQRAEREGIDQEEFNDRMNNPDYYQIEDPHENRSHTHEMPMEVEPQDYLGDLDTQQETSSEDYLGSVQDAGQGQESVLESDGMSY